jgi:carbonic anhydrase
MREIVWQIRDASGEARPHPADAATARARLEAGNDAFAELFGGGDDSRRMVQLAPEELGIGESGHAPEQHPFASVLSCADARVPVEMLFSQRANDLFVVRVAGGVLGESAMGSLDYSVAHLPTVRLVVVLGHTRCGPYSYVAMGDSRPLLALVHNLLGPVRLAAVTLEEVHGPKVGHRPGYSAALVDLAVVANAGVVATAIAARNARRAAVVGRLVQTGFGVYDLVSRRVGVPGPGSEWVSGIQQPPATKVSFATHLREIAVGPHISHLLEDGDD